MKLQKRKKEKKNKMTPPYIHTDNFTKEITEIVNERDWLFGISGDEYEVSIQQANRIKKLMNRGVVLNVSQRKVYEGRRI